jgi:hypothetical protein
LAIRAHFVLTNSASGLIRNFTAFPATLYPTVDRCFYAFSGRFYRCGFDGKRPAVPSALAQQQWLTISNLPAGFICWNRYKTGFSNSRKEFQDPSWTLGKLAPFILISTVTAISYTVERSGIPGAAGFKGGFWLLKYGLLYACHMRSKSEIT